jgi:hypothetical protein
LLQLPLQQSVSSEQSVSELPQSHTPLASQLPEKQTSLLWHAPPVPMSEQAPPTQFPVQQSAPERHVAPVSLHAQSPPSTHS